MKQFEIRSFEAGQRMDRFTSRLLSSAPKSFIYKMLRKKNIVLNDKKATGQEILKAGDIIKIYFSDETFEKFAQGSGQVTVTAASGNIRKPKIIYEDEDILILNKPKGLLSQKAAPGDYSANDFVLEYLMETGQLSQQDLKTFRPSICNRLDRNTSGLLTAGKTMHGLQELSRLLRQRTLKKYYLCLAEGVVRKPFHLKGYLKKDRRANKVTVQDKPFQGADPVEITGEPVRYAGNVTLLRIHLITGRSHQIRVQLAHAGHPILGDFKYGGRKLNEWLKQKTGIESQLLHAWKMELPDGRNWIADMPEDFEKAMNVMHNCRQEDTYK